MTILGIGRASSSRILKASECVNGKKAKPFIRAAAETLRRRKLFTFSPLPTSFTSTKSFQQDSH